MRGCVKYVELVLEGSIVHRHDLLEDSCGESRLGTFHQLLCTSVKIRKGVSG